MKTSTIFEKLIKTKGIGYIVIALVAGVALLVLNLGGKAPSAPEQDKNALFVSETEQTLETLARSVCGVKCKAKVRLGTGYSYAYASDQSVRTVYNADGSVAEKETALNNRTVNVSGGTSLVPVKEVPPTVVGVVLVCKGGTSADVLSLKAMVGALYGLKEDAIYVTN